MSQNKAIDPVRRTLKLQELVGKVGTAAMAFGEAVDHSAPPVTLEQHAMVLTNASWLLKMEVERLHMWVCGLRLEGAWAAPAEGQETSRPDERSR